MRKLKLFFACLLMAVLSIGQMWGTEAVYKQTIFHSDYQPNNSSYTGTFTNTTDSFAVTVGNANNNNNGWSSGHIKVGRKNNTSTAYIKTNAAIDKAITKVTLTIAAINANNVTSIKLYTSSNGSSWTEVSSFTKATGAQDAEIESTNQAANLYYKIELACPSLSGNGNGAELSKVEFYAEEGGGGDVIVKTLKSIAVSGQTTTYDQFSPFSFDGTCTATYSVTKNDVPQPDEQEEVTPTNVSSPDMSTTGEKTVTVTYEENEVSKTVDYTITVNPHTVTPGKYSITLNNALWGTSYTSSTTSTSADALDLSGSSNDVQVSLTNGSSTYMYITDAQTRAYAGYTLIFAVPTGYNITKIEFTKASKWGLACESGLNADADTWTGEASSVEFTFTARTDMTSVNVTFEEVDQTIVKTLKSIAVSEMTTSYEVGDVFSFDGICTATYTVTQGGEAQPDENKTVNPTSVSSPDMSTTGEKTVTVTYEENEVSKTVDYTINVNPHTVAPGEYGVLLNNVLWGVEAGQQDAGVTSMEGSSHDINFATTKGSSQMYASATQTRFYANATLTISAPTGYNITSVVFAEPSSDKKWDGSISADEGTYTADTKTWSGEATAVVFTFGAQNRIGTATVTYAVVDPTAPAVSVVSSIDNVPAAGVAGQVLDVTYTNVDLANVDYALFNDAECQSAFTDEWLSVSLNGDKDIVYTIAANASYVEGRTAYIQLTAPASNGTSADVVKVIAIEQLKKEYVFASLAELLETVTPTTEAIDVTVTLTNEVIRGIDLSGTYRNGVYFDVTYGNPAQTKRIELYCWDVPAAWEIGDKLSGTLTSCPWKIHTTTWELAPKSGWEWTDLTRTPKGDITSIAVSGEATKTVYSSGESFLFDGLVATATYENGYQEVVTPDSWAADPATITADGNVAVTATIGAVTSPVYDVAVTVAAKTLVSIAVGTASYTIYTGEALPQPVVTATFSEGEPEDVSAFAVYDSENVFNTATIDNPDPQTITVSYTFGGETKTATYTVSVQDYANNYTNPYTPAEALYITTHAIGETKSARDIYVQGIVSRANAVTGSNKRQRYWISEDGETTSTEFEVYNGKYLAGADFSSSNQLVAGDEVIVVGKVIYYQSTAPQFATGESQLYSLARTPNFTIEDVASLEVGADDLAEGDLDITTPSEGEITFVSGDDTKATIVANAIHAVAPGTVTITANMAADGIYKATSTTFSVTVIAATDKYAITFDGNGNTGGSAPAAIADKAAGDEVTLPANSYTKTNKIFDGWKVINNTTTEEVPVAAGKFSMPASAVTIQAQWADPSVWALTYTSNVEISSNENKKVIISGTEYDAVKANSGSTATITLPLNTTTIHLHLVAWNGEAQTVTVTGDCFNDPINLAISADAGVKSTGNYTLEGNAYEYYFSLTPDNAVANNEVITITAAGGKRFVLFGVNQEGGVLPVLDHIAITGTMTNTTGWKTGDNITPAGLTVNAYYTLNEVMQDPVDVTTSVVWSHDALIEDQTEVTLTATYTENTIVKSANVNVTIEAVETGDPTITTDVNSRSWTVEKDAAIPDAKTFAVTLKNIASATITKGGDNPEAFNVSPSTLTASGNITVSVVSTETVGTYTATITIKDDASETSKVVNVNLTVNAPETPETPVSTTSEWVAATEIVNGMQVLIVGERNEKIYAVGAQTSNNRTAVEGSLSEGVFTPGENTMAFTVVAQEGGTYALQASNGKYLYAAGSGSGKNYLRSQDEVDDNAKWTLSVSSATANGTNTNNKLQLNNSSDIFSCYSSTQKAIALYVPKPVVTYVAQIGETMYESLPAAVAAAVDGQTVELLMDVAAGPGVMITTAEHKQIIIDFGNHTYCANSPAVGSAGTQNQAFHFEKGCNITLQNGTITSSGNEIIMLIQNYGDLTLKNITLIGNNLPGTHRYVLSNNCGHVVIGEGTTITAKEGDVAFDVCVTNYYPEGTQVTVEDGATITGIVEYDVWGTIPADNKATLTIEGGNFDITWNVEPALAEDAKDNINVSGGTFNAEVPADYCAHGFIPKDNGNGQYGVYYAGYYERGSLTPGNYATICLPYAGKISGASLFDIEYYENSTLYLLEVEGNAMVAGRPYIFLPSSDKIEVTYTDAVSATAGSFNGLVGSLSLEKEEITPNDGNYILYNNQYWYVNSLAYVGANRAYIHMDDVPTQPSQQQGAPRRRVAMQVNGQNTTTGVDNLNAGETPVKVMINGQLFILRGEKMYNANGQLVK